MRPRILITGAASGIGRAVAEHFHARGWDPILLDRDGAALEPLARRLHDDDGHPAVHLGLDVRDTAALQARLLPLLEDGLDVLFNGAGLLHSGRFDQVALSDHADTVSVNVIGLMTMTHLALPALRRRAADGVRAVVINMGSASALYGVPWLSSYSASKFAVRALTEAWQIEWEEDRIHVCDLMPPFVNTPMVTGQGTPPPVLRKLGASMQPEQVARAAWAAVTGARIHHPLGSLRWLGALERLAPRGLTRRVMRWLSRDIPGTQ